MAVEIFGVRTPAADDWDNNRKTMIKNTIGCKQTGMAGTHGYETQVITWSAETGNPLYFIQRRRGVKDQQDPTLYDLMEIPNHSGWTDTQVDTLVDNVIADVPSGVMGKIAGWLVFHESYSGAFSKMQRAIERLLIPISVVISSFPYERRPARPLGDRDTLKPQTGKRLSFK